MRRLRCSSRCRSKPTLGSRHFMNGLGSCVRWLYLAAHIVAICGTSTSSTAFYSSGARALRRSGSHPGKCLMTALASRSVQPACVPVASIFIWLTFACVLSVSAAGNFVLSVEMCRAQPLRGSPPVSELSACLQVRMEMCESLTWAEATPARDQRRRSAASERRSVAQQGDS